MWVCICEIFPKSSSRGGPESRKLHALDLRRRAHNVLSPNGLLVSARLRFLVFRCDDGFATVVGEDHGSRNQGSAVGTNSETVRHRIETRLRFTFFRFNWLGGKSMVSHPPG